MERLNHRGVFTLMVETFGWKETKELFNDNAEKRHKNRP
jgi:hypothetical protein